MLKAQPQHEQIEICDDDIDFARIKSLFSQSHIYIFITFCLSVIVSSILWKSSNSKVFFYWFSLMFIVVAVRFFTVYRFKMLSKNNELDFKKSMHWENTLCLLLILTGLSWFALLQLATRHTSIFEAGILFACLSALVSVSIQTYSHSFKAYVCFASATLFPSSIYLIFSLNTGLQVLGHIGFYFFLITLFASWTLSRFTYDGVKRELQNQYLLQQMDIKQMELLKLNAQLEEDINARKLIEQKMAAEQLKTEKLNDKLLAMSSLDGLTGIANQYRFNEFLNKEWGHSSRNHLPISLLLCNIDNLQAYNEKFGIQRGDRTICILAGLLEDFARRGTDIAARLTSDKFAILFASTNIDNARSIAERLRQTFFELDIPNPSSQTSKYLTLSIGIASMVPTTENDSQELIDKTEAALAKAKSSGKNRVCSAAMLSLASHNTENKLSS